MRRRDTRIASIFSLVLCLAAATLWLRSYSRTYEFDCADGSLFSSRGILFYQFSFLSVPKLQQGFHSLDAFYVPTGYSGPNYLYLHFAGIEFARGGKHILLFAVPFWVIVLLTGSVSLSLKLLSAGRRLSNDKVCYSCGYNLIGNVSGVCPECGTKTPQGVSS